MDWMRGLGPRLIIVSATIVAVVGVVVATVVLKLSEDEVKDRLMGQADELARVVESFVGGGGDTDKLNRVVLTAKLRETGTAWVLDREGRFVTNPDPRYQPYLDKCLPFGDVEIQLTAVQQPLQTIGEKASGHRVPLKSVVGRYEAGLGVVSCLGEPHVAAFRVLADRGWIVGVDEPITRASSAAASLRKYIVITCAALGLAILLGTAISISYVIKPFYREKLALSQRIEAANRNLKKLHDVSVSIQKSLSLDDRVRQILGAAHEVLGLDRIYILLPNQDCTYLECRGAFGAEADGGQFAVPLGDAGGVLAQTFLRRKTYRVLNSRELPPGLRLAPPYSEIKALRSRSFVALPMVVGDECVGVVAVDNRISKAPITPEVIEGLELFTGHAAVAIENARLYQQLKLYADELEVTDHLTQLFTFFHFKKLLQGHIDRARISGENLALVVFSIDNFARYNELLGHKYGDDVLRAVADRIRDSAREEDIIGRCFGSTFAVILPGVNLEEAEATANTVASRLGDHYYPGQESLPEKKVLFRRAAGVYRRGEAVTAEELFNRINEQLRGPGGLMAPRNPVPTADVVIENGPGVVLVRRRFEPQGWALPGGFVEAGETLEQAAVREAREETGLEVALVEQFFTYSDPNRDPRQHTMTTVYLATASGRPRGGDDAAEARVWPWDELPEPLCFDHQRILADVRRYRRGGGRPLLESAAAL